MNFSELIRKCGEPNAGLKACNPAKVRPYSGAQVLERGNRTDLPEHSFKSPCVLAHYNLSIWFESHHALWCGTSHDRLFGHLWILRMSGLLRLWKCYQPVSVIRLTCSGVTAPLPCHDATPKGGQIGAKRRRGGRSADSCLEQGAERPSNRAVREGSSQVPKSERGQHEEL